MKKLFILITVFSLTACLEQETGTSTSSSNSGNDGEISGTTGDNGGSTTGTTGSSGTNGNNGGYPYHTLDLMLSGHQSTPAQPVPSMTARLHARQRQP